MIGTAGEAIQRLPIADAEPSSRVHLIAAIDRDRDRDDDGERAALIADGRAQAGRTLETDAFVIVSRTRH